MSAVAASPQISTPVYYHREYENDLPKEEVENSILDQCKRVSLVALPFISLYKPLSLPVSLGMGGLRIVTSLSQLISELQNGDISGTLYACLQTAIAVIALAGTILAHPLGMLITTVHDCAMDCFAMAKGIYVGDFWEFAKGSGSLLNNVLYLALFAHGGLEIAIASLAMQIFMGVSHSINDLKEGNLLEAGGHFLMGIVRGNQMKGQVELLQFKWEIEASINAASTGHSQVGIRASQKKQIAPPRSGAPVMKQPMAAIGYGCAENANSQVLAATDGGKKAGYHHNIYSNSSQIDLSAICVPDEMSLEAILAKYANNPLGIPALHYAIVEDDAYAVRILLEYGASPDAKSRQSIGIGESLPLELSTPLDFAAKFGRLNIVKLLIEHGATINQEYEYETNERVIEKYRMCSPLYFASKYDNEDIVNCLIAHGALLEPTDPQFISFYPIFIATESGSIKALKALVEAGAKIDISKERSLLHVAADADQGESIEFLVNAGLNVNVRATGGYTALHLSIMRNSLAAARALIEMKADINALDAVGQTPLILLMQCNISWGKTEILERIKLLIQSGADLKIKDISGRDVFRRFMDRFLYSDNDFEQDAEFKKIFYYLLERGASINARDERGYTIMRIAKLKENQKKYGKALVKWLQDHGAKE